MARSAQQVVLLDLDGTLTQSDPGIIACVEKAFEELHLPVPSHEALHKFIGPPISESMQKNNIPADKMADAVRIYREYYSDRAVFDDPNEPGNKVPGRLFNRIYDGIPAQLEILRKAGYTLVVATCKPEYQAIPICDHFHLTPLVDGVYGASADTSRMHKDEVITYAFEHLNFDGTKGDRALMVGDRWTDVDGAIACGLDCLGCRWGYAEPNELEQHGAYRIIEQVDELSGAVESYFDGQQRTK